MFNTETTKCSCGCDKCRCEFNPCAVTCEPCVRNLGDYAYVYNTTAQTVEPDAAVTFSSNGPLSGTITHTAGTAEIVIGRTGVYLVKFYADASAEDDETQFTVYLNGESVIGATYSSTGGGTYGQFIVSAQTGDIMTLVNTGEGTVTFAAEGTTPEAVVNASMTIVKLF